MLQEAFRYRGTYSSVARSFGVSRQYVWQVVHGIRNNLRIVQAIEREQARLLQLAEEQSRRAAADERSYPSQPAPEEKLSNLESGN